jgi:hypothetical protein
MASISVSLMSGLNLQAELLGDDRDVLQVLLAVGAVDMEEADGLQTDVLAPGHQRAKLFAVFGTNRKDHRLVRAAQRRRPGHRADEGHLGLGGDLHHRRRRAAFDRAKQQESAVLHELARVGLGDRILAFVIHCAHDDLAAMNAAGGVDAIQIQLHARLGGDAIAVLAGLQRHRLADDDFAVVHTRREGRGGRRRRCPRGGHR